MKNTGIVTIYDLKNNGAPLVCHATDANEFLRHDRWSTSPDVAKRGDAAEMETAEDNGEAMRLKGMTYKALQGLARKAGIEGYQAMSRAELVEALKGGENE